MQYIQHKNGLGFKDLGPVWKFKDQKANEELTEVCHNTKEDKNEASKNSKTKTD